MNKTKIIDIIENEYNGLYLGTDKYYVSLNKVNPKYIKNLSDYEKEENIKEFTFLIFRFENLNKKEFFNMVSTFKHHIVKPFIVRRQPEIYVRISLKTIKRQYIENYYHIN